VLVGNQRSYLAALVTAVAPAAADSATALTDARVQAAVDGANATLPHYKQIRAFAIVPEAFTIENGLLTANGKLKRDAIAARYANEIEAMYVKKPA
jgi:long-chain acyl-CoA synthetase